MTSTCFTSLSEHAPCAARTSSIMSTVEISPLLPRPSLASLTDHTHTHTQAVIRHRHRHRPRHTHTHNTHTHTHTHTHTSHQTASMSMMPVTHRMECSAILAPLANPYSPWPAHLSLGLSPGSHERRQNGFAWRSQMRTAIVSTRQLPAIPALFAMNRISCSFDSPLEAFERPWSPRKSARPCEALPAHM
jgi:hypothetical protein